MTDNVTAAAFDAKSFLANLTSRPGVYRMFGAGDEVLYVGKARNLKRRVASYFRASGLAPKTAALMRQTERVEVTVTHTEAEALILEANLIKAHRPRYNVLLRDDKSYPWIHLGDGDYPRLALHRGARRAKGRFFGPYPNAGAVRESLHLLQKVFRVRQCEDSFFRNRSRPCLQYQIKRCTAPCVGLVSPEQYAEDVQHTVLFLEGKSSELTDRLVERMERAAQALDYEQAALYRDRIASLRRVQERQYVSGESGDLDIVATVVSGGAACVQVFFVRSGRNLGNKVFFPRMPAGSSSPEEVLSAFLAQYYLVHEVPARILVNCPPPDEELLSQVLSDRAGRRVTLSHRLRGERLRWLRMGVANAEQALAARLSGQAGMQRRLADLQQVLRLDEAPSRMECFDISHTRGEGTVASCVVFDAEGARKQDYRRFSVTGITPGDDYAAMAQALERRYARLKRESAVMPDVLFIDGGKGQVTQALEVLDELQVDDVLVVGVAKGPERRPGLEVLHLPTQGRKLELPPDSPALHLVQQIRDEAHRFAIAGHRSQRARARSSSPLERIPGIGPKRRQQLLRQFGGLQEVARAGVEDLSRVKGISPLLAQQIYDAFHDGD